jgi:hypothetical protein
MILHESTGEYIKQTQEFNINIVETYYNYEFNLEIYYIVLSEDLSGENYKKFNFDIESINNFFYNTPKEILDATKEKIINKKVMENIKIKVMNNKLIKSFNDLTKYDKKKCTVHPFKLLNRKITKKNFVSKPEIPLNSGNKITVNLFLEKYIGQQIK